MRPARALGFWLGVLAQSCGGEREPAPGAAKDSTPLLADSLVLVAGDSAQVWLTAGRPDTASTGEVCVERALEIRRPGAVTPVPLLYTMGAPEVVNDTIIRAALYRHCVPAAWYRVSTRTGRPEREQQ